MYRITGYYLEIFTSSPFFASLSKCFFCFVIKKSIYILISARTCSLLSVRKMCIIYHCLYANIIQGITTYMRLIWIHEYETCKIFIQNLRAIVYFCLVHSWTRENMRSSFCSHLNIYIIQLFAKLKCIATDHPWQQICS